MADYGWRRTCISQVLPTAVSHGRGLCGRGLVWSSESANAQHPKLVRECLDLNTVLVPQKLVPWTCWGQKYFRNVGEVHRGSCWQLPVANLYFRPSVEGSLALSVCRLCHEDRTGWQPARSERNMGGCLKVKCLHNPKRFLIIFPLKQQLFDRPSSDIPL